MIFLRRFFMLVAVICCSGCGTVLYCRAQMNDSEMRTQSNKLPVGNILCIDRSLWNEAWSREDEILPPWLDRSLTSIAIICDVPFSLMFDILTFPWQLYCHETLNSKDDGKSPCSGVL